MRSEIFTAAALAATMVAGAAEAKGVSVHDNAKQIHSDLDALEFDDKEQEGKYRDSSSFLQSMKSTIDSRVADPKKAAELFSRLSQVLELQTKEYGDNPSVLSGVEKSFLNFYAEELGIASGIGERSKSLQEELQDDSESLEKIFSSKSNATFEKKIQMLKELIYSSPNKVLEYNGIRFVLEGDKVIAVADEVSLSLTKDNIGDIGGLLRSFM